jgi:hypothetical protein
MMPGYKNLSFTRLGGRRQTFCPKKTIHFIFCVSIFPTQNFLMIIMGPIERKGAQVKGICRRVFNWRSLANERSPACLFLCPGDRALL